MPQEPLHWARGDALTEIVGEIVITDLYPGETRVVTVDHSAAAEFALYTPPEIEPVEGLRVRLLCDGLTGGGFRVEVQCEEDGHSTQYGYGGEGPDWVIRWRRRGVLR